MQELPDSQKQSNPYQDAFIIYKNYREKSKKKPLRQYLDDQKLETSQKPFQKEAQHKLHSYKPSKAHSQQLNKKQVTNLNEIKVFPLIVQKNDQKNGQLFYQQEEKLDHVIPFQGYHDLDILYNVSSHDGHYDKLELALFGYPRSDTQLQKQ